MAVDWPEESATIHAVSGIRLASAAAGIRYQGRDDLVLIELTADSRCAAVFTRNAFCAAPVVVAREHLQLTAPRYLLINAGNANAGTGDEGMEAARTCCRLVADATGCLPQEVLPFSTGVIAEPLPVAPFENALPGLASSVNEEGWARAASAIMTTDTVAKAVSRQVEIAGRAVTISGMAKGSGMIHPDMATMLAYIATDARLPQALLQRCLKEAVEISFNRISVDGDTSTNDACVLMASGASGVDIDDSSLPTFRAALFEVATWLARAVVRDGEGATKFVTIDVEGGRDEAECRQVAMAIARSPLVKTALFASDPNWGRILAAVGYAGLEQLDLSTVNMYLGDVCIVSKGGRAPQYTEAQGQQAMDGEEITIRVELGRGEAVTRVWTCDLSYDYVRINAEYRS